MAISKLFYPFDDLKGCMSRRVRHIVYGLVLRHLHKRSAFKQAQAWGMHTNIIVIHVDPNNNNHQVQIFTEIADEVKQTRPRLNLA